MRGFFLIIVMNIIFFDVDPLKQSWQDSGSPDFKVDTSVQASPKWSPANSALEYLCQSGSFLNGKYVTMGEGC